MAVTSAHVKRLAHQAGFELAGIAPALPLADYPRFRAWLEAGRAATMGYLTDHRDALRADPRNLLPTARSILCVGRLYNAPQPDSTGFTSQELGSISRYAWGEDYHAILRRGLEQVVASLQDALAGSQLDSRICVDTAPLLERSLARQAGLGWIGNNTCLINQHAGSWFFLGELLLSLHLEPDAAPPPRCGSCTRCIEECPTAALVPSGDGWTLDSKLCISYLTIEMRGNVEESLRSEIGRHIFGCDICQDVCPWNRRAALTIDPAFTPLHPAPRLDRFAALTEQEFRNLFRHTAVSRVKYEGFLRNVAVAMGNSGNPNFCEPLRRLAAHPSPVVAEHARWALARLE